MIAQLVRYLGPAAYVNGAIGIVGAILLITLFTTGEPRGGLSTYSFEAVLYFARE